MTTTPAAAGLAFNFATSAKDSHYSVRHWEGQAIVERWFPTRMDRSKYLISIGGGPILTWEDPADDYSTKNVYGPGKDMRSVWR